MKKFLLLILSVLVLLISSNAFAVTHLRNYNPLLCRHLVPNATEFANPTNYTSGTEYWGRLYISSGYQIVNCPVESEFGYTGMFVDNSEVFEQNVDSIDSISLNYSVSANSNFWAAVCAVPVNQSQTTVCGTWKQMVSSSNELVFYSYDYSGLYPYGYSNIIAIYNNSTSGTAWVTGYRTTSNW